MAAGYSGPGRGCGRRLKSWVWIYLWFVVSHPFARKKAKGWGTGACLGELTRGFRRFPPFRQKKGERMGHGASLGELTRGFRGFPPFRQKKGERMGHGASLGELTRGIRGFPPFRQKKGERMGHGASLGELTRGYGFWEGPWAGVRGSVLRPWFICGFFYSRAATMVRSSAAMEARRGPRAGSGPFSREYMISSSRARAVPRERPKVPRTPASL